MYVFIVHSNRTQNSFALYCASMFWGQKLVLKYDCIESCRVGQRSQILLKQVAFLWTQNGLERYRLALVNFMVCYILGIEIFRIIYPYLISTHMIYISLILSFQFTYFSSIKILNYSWDFSKMHNYINKPYILKNIRFNLSNRIKIHF